MVCVNSLYWLGRSESKRRPGALACKKRLKDARARQSNQAFGVIEQTRCFFWLVGSVPSDESTRATDRSAAFSHSRPALLGNIYRRLRYRGSLIELTQLVMTIGETCQHFRFKFQPCLGGARKCYAFAQGAYCTGNILSNTFC